MSEIRIARIDPATGLVVNVEVATAEWAASHDGPDRIVEVSPAEPPPHIGMAYDDSTGFAQPERPDVYTLTDADLVTLGVDIVRWAI